MEEILFTQVMDNLYSYYLQLVLKIKSQVIIAVFVASTIATPSTFFMKLLKPIAKTIWIPCFFAIMGKRLINQPTFINRLGLSKPADR